MATDRQFKWDKDFPGFGLQTTSTGHQSFVYQYRVGLDQPAHEARWRLVSP